MRDSAFFTSGKLGPLTLRNRSIRAAAFEGMSQNHTVTKDLIDYHTSIVKGGVAMTTVAYASVSKSGLSFPHQLWLREKIKPGLKEISDNIHREGGAISIQIGHCGNMADKNVTGLKPLAPTNHINWYGPTFPKRMDKRDIKSVVDDFKSSVKLVAECGFDAVEVHAGHGYLISQFLSPYTNKRKDEYGGDFENRSRFMREVLSSVKEAMPKHMALIVKMNSSDGFDKGISHSESLLTAKSIETCGADAIVVSGGFVSKAPMYVLRGKMPIDIMAYFMKDQVKKFFVKQFGKMLIQPVTFKEGYFLDEATEIKKQVDIQVIPVGGMNSLSTIEGAMDRGFDFIAIARALIENPGFINDLRNEVIDKSKCTICNFCVAKMYSGQMTCHLNDSDMEPELIRQIEKMEHV